MSTTHVLVSFALDLKHDPSRVEYYHGYWYSEEDPSHPLEEVTGTREEVITWAESKGTDVEVQDPDPEILAANRRDI